MSLRFRKKVLLAKIETTYGTDATPTGAANAMLASNISIQPMEGSDAERGHDQPFLGNDGTIPYDLHSRMTFQVELAGSGTAGTAPAWGPLLRACGAAETIAASTSVTYNPISDGFESATIYLNIDGTLYALLGARGTATFRVNASAIPVIEFEFTGLWTKPVASALPTADVSAFQKPLVGSAANTPTFTIDGTGHVMRNFALVLGNEVEARFLIGAEAIEIIDRAETLETQIEAVALSTLDPFALARDQGTVAVSLVHGKTAGSIATIAVPNAQVQRPGSPVEAQGIKEWPLNFAPKPVTGNDQWTLTLT